MHVAAPNHQLTTAPASFAGCGGPETGRDSMPPLAVGSLDRVLAGLIGRNHGREACAAYLGHLDAALMDRVVKLGLPTPSDRPLRLGHGPKAWSLLDIRRLIDLWCRNLPGSRIADFLGRSEGGVHAKARWLGLFRRPRSALLRAHEMSLPALEGSPQPPEPEPSTAAPMRREVHWTEAMEDEVADRWFALQSHRGIARDMGLSPTAVASKAHRLQLPCRHGIALHDDHRPERRAEAMARLFAGWTRRVCNIRKKPFWTKHKGIVFSDEARRQAAWQGLQGVVH